MSEPEVKFEIDEYGRIGYRVTNEGVLLSKDEKEFIIDHITRMQEENAKLRELAARAYKTARMMCEAWDGPCQSNSDVPSWRVPCPTDERDEQCVFGQLEHDMRELGVEVD